MVEDQKANPEHIAIRRMCGHPQIPARSLLHSLSRAVVAGFALLEIACATQAHRRVPDDAAKRHIEQVRLSLPLGSFIRNALTIGFHGNGIREPWMDHMREQGVKGARFDIHGRWFLFLGLFNAKITRTMYFQKYGGPSSQITDPQFIARIRDSKLERELQTVALARANRATKSFLSFSEITCSACFAEVNLLDDEWLLTDRTSLAEYAPTVTPLEKSAEAGDVVSVNALLAERRYSQAELDRALLCAVSPNWDSSETIARLLTAGANPRARRPDGSTPLMEAAQYVDATAAKLLLQAGADVDARDQNGETALSIAERRSCTRGSNVPREGATEFIQALKQFRARE